MITNTNRILYNSEYIPAYVQEAAKRIRYKGSNYNIEFMETSTDRVFKVELENCLITYLSDCEVEVDTNYHVPIHYLRVGDSVLTYLDNQLLLTKKTSARKLALAFLGDKVAEEEVKVKYKQTVLGIVWVVLQPILTMIIFTILFTLYLQKLKFINMAYNGSLSKKAPFYYYSNKYKAI